MGCCTWHCEGRNVLARRVFITSLCAPLLFQPVVVSNRCRTSEQQGLFPASLPPFRPASQECRSFNRSAPSSWMGCCCPLRPPYLPPSLLATCQVGRRCRWVPSLPFPPSGGGERGREREGHANQPSHFPHNRASEEGRAAAAGGELLSYSLGVGSGAFAGERGKEGEGEGGELQPFKMRRRRKDMLLSHSLANPRGASSRMATPVFSYLIPSQNDGFLLAFLSLSSTLK